MSKRRQELWRAFKFLLISASAGLIEFGTYSVLTIAFPSWGYWPPYLIGLVLSVIWNFTINRRYTFKSANNVPAAMLKVFAFYAVFTPLSTWGGDYLADTLLWNGFLVTLLNMVVNFILEFLYQRYYVFRKTIDTNDLAAKQPKDA